MYKASRRLGRTGKLTMQEPRKPYDIDSLTDVAVRVFAERGYDGSSMDDIARAAGITKASIYHHIAGKEALLERCLDRALGALFAILDEAPARTGVAIVRLRYIVRRVATITLHLLPELSVLFRVRGNSMTESAAIERRRDFNRLMTALIAEAKRDGDIAPSTDPALAARLIFGMSNSVVDWYRAGRSTGPAEVVDAIERMALDGILIHRAVPTLK